MNILCFDSTYMCGRVQLDIRRHLHLSANSRVNTCRHTQWQCVSVPAVKQFWSVCHLVVMWSVPLSSWSQRVLLTCSPDCRIEMKWKILICSVPAKVKEEKEICSDEVTRYYCELVDKVLSAGHNLGKDGRFQLFICLGARLVFR